MEIRDPRIERKPIKEIRPYGKNHKKHSEEQVNRLVRSLDEFGMTHPIIVNPKGIIIAGEGRWLALKKMKAEVVPVIVLDLPEDKERLYRIADNELGSFGVVLDFQTKIDELRDFNFDQSLLDLATLTTRDFVFSLKTPKDDIRSGKFIEFENAERELQEIEDGERDEQEPITTQDSEVPREIIGGFKQEDTKTFYFSVEIRGTYKKDSLKNQVQEKLKDFGAVVR